MLQHPRDETPLLHSEEIPTVECEVCEEEFTEGSLVNLTSNKFNTYLKDYHIYSICPECYEQGKGLFRQDIELFISWLEENDQRVMGLPLSDPRKKLRKDFNLSVELLSDDPEKYYDQMDKCAARTEDILVWLMDRYTLDIDTILTEFNKHKVKLL